MSNFEYVVSSEEWVLVYDSSVTGDFSGYAQVVNGAELSVYIGASIPAGSIFGAIVGGSPRHLAINAFYGDKLYARRRGNTAMLSLMADSGWAQRLAGATLAYTEDWNALLTSTYQKVATTTASTKSLRMSAACNATAYDIEYQVVTAGGAAPTTTGQALLAGDDFLAGIPVGDIYARSATAQKLIVWRA